MLGALFEQHDRDGAGGLALDEFKALCGKVCATRGLDDREVEAAFRRGRVEHGRRRLRRAARVVRGRGERRHAEPADAAAGASGDVPRRAVSEEADGGGTRRQGALAATVPRRRAASPRSHAAAPARRRPRRGVARWFALGRLDGEPDDGAAWPHYALRWFASEAAAARRRAIRSARSRSTGATSTSPDGGGEGATTLELVTSSAPGLLVLR